MVLRYLKIKVLILGGYDDGGNTSDSVLEFDIKKNQVKKIARLPCALWGMATVRWRDKVVVLGGCDGEDNILNDVYMYDCKTGKITALPPMLEKRYECCAVIIGDTIVVMGGWRDKVVVLGGCDGEDNILNDVYMYDCKTGKITALPPMLEKRYECYAVIIGDTIVVMGGLNEKRGILSSVECFTMGAGGYSWAYSSHE